jgi:hypothetical protein
MAAMASLAHALLAAVIDGAGTRARTPGKTTILKTT